MQLLVNMCQVIILLCDLAMRFQFKTLISPILTRVSGHLVVTGKSYMTEGRRFKSHLELGIFLVDVISKFIITIL